jgi:hypothetical protein
MPIKVSSKNPHTISVSKKGMTVGKWMTNYLLPKKTPLEEEFSQTKKRLKKLGKEWKKLKPKKLEKSPQGQMLLREFYRNAVNYTETYWKICDHKILTGNKSRKLKKSRDQAKKDFDYFFDEYQKYKHPEEYIKELEKKAKSKRKVKIRKKTDLEIVAERSAKKLEESRKDVFKTEKEFGKESWHAKRSLLKYVQNRASFSKAEANRLYEIRPASPQMKEMITNRLAELDKEFKEMSKATQRLKDGL